MISWIKGVDGFAELPGAPGAGAELTQDAPGLELGVRPLITPSTRGFITPQADTPPRLGHTHSLPKIRMKTLSNCTAASHCWPGPAAGRDLRQLRAQVTSGVAEHGYSPTSYQAFVL